MFAFFGRIRRWEWLFGIALIGVVLVWLLSSLQRDIVWVKIPLVGMTLSSDSGRLQILVFVPERTAKWTFSHQRGEASGEHPMDPSFRCSLFQWGLYWALPHWIVVLVAGSLFGFSWRLRSGARAEPSHDALERTVT